MAEFDVWSEGIAVTEKDGQSDKNSSTCNTLII